MNSSRVQSAGAQWTIAPTLACPARCSYCPTVVAKGPRLAVALLLRAIARVVRLRGGWPAHLEVSYLGGEVAALAPSHLGALVRAMRGAASGAGVALRDGAQSALIGSVGRVHALVRLFGARIGTSTERTGTERRFGLGSVDVASDRYREASDRGRRAVARRTGIIPGAVFTVGPAHLVDPAVSLGPEIDHAVRLGALLVVRPVLPDAVGAATLDPHGLARLHAYGVRRWLLRLAISIEPYGALLDRWLGEVRAGALCGHQTDCSRRSAWIGPEGEVNLCWEMHVLGVSPLIASDGTVDLRRHAEYQDRPRVVASDPQCRTCRWQGPCQGGCMAVALAYTGRTDAHDPHCIAYKAIFSAFEAAAQRHGTHALLAWRRTHHGVR